MVGLLLGLPHPYQTARQLVNVKLIRPAELRDCLDQGAAGRAELQQRFLDQGNPTISDLDRPSVT